MWQKIKNIYHLFTAMVANVYYGFPGEKLTVIGVTGTDGKTTTVNMIYSILKDSGESVSMISTVKATIHGNSSSLAFHVTTPDFFVIQKFLSAAVKNHKGTGKNYLVLEVSSHAIDQYRIWGIPFAIAVITNVTNEHLDYHKTYENYLNTKVKLLKHARIAVINRDDNSYPLINKKLKTKNLKLQSKNEKVITYGLHRSADVNPELFPFKTKLPGEHNLYNTLAAISVCRELGITDEKIRKSLEAFQAPVGRLDAIENDRGLHIYIDYAHTPNAVEQVLKTLQETKGKNSRLICLIGAEGKRDPGKRAKMGEMATRFSNKVIITAVDPRGFIEEINTQILEGAKKAGGKTGETVYVEPDRQKAITFAINTLAHKGDIVAILCKGHERSMNYDGKHEEPWSDYEAVEKTLKNV